MFHLIQLTMNNFKRNIIVLILLILCSTTFTACIKTSVPAIPNPPFELYPSAGDVSLSLTIDTTKLGLRIPSSFTGLSFEANASASSSYFSTNNTSFINLVKALGSNGILRMGANSCDKMIWSNSLSGGVNSQTTIYRDYVDRFIKFSKAVGWKTIFGLDVGSGTPAQALNEVKYINSTYPNTVLYYEIGNEPDLFHDWCRASTYGEAAYLNTFDSFYAPIHAALPALNFEGPATSWNLSGFTIPFINARNTDLSMMTHHYYYAGANSTNATTHHSHTPLHNTTQPDRTPPLQLLSVPL